MNSYQNDGKRKAWKRKGKPNEPKHTTSCVWRMYDKYGSQKKHAHFYFYVIAVKSSTINSDLQTHSFCSSQHRWSLKETQDLFKAKKSNIIQWASQPPDLNLNRATLIYTKFPPDTSLSCHKRATGLLCRMQEVKLQRQKFQQHLRS